MIDLAKLSKQRYACSKYDNTNKIEPKIAEQLYTLLRNSPSAANVQPWHFLVTDQLATKQLIAESVLSHSQSRILDCSIVIVFCTQNNLSEQHLQQVLSVEDKLNRFSSVEEKQRMDEVRHLFIQINNKTPQHLRAWQEKQLYLALGSLLIGAAALGIDSAAIEGFNHQQLDDSLKLSSKGLASIVIATLGYRSIEDSTASKQKARLSEQQIFSFI